MKTLSLLKVLILIAFMSKSGSSETNHASTSNLFDILVKSLNEPNAKAGIRIQRMSSNNEDFTESVEELSAEASTIDQNNSIYSFPVVKLNDANFTQFASQHEWIYVKFFTDWCPHSRKIIPTWHEVSYRLSSTSVAVAEIQCEIDDDTLCEKFKVVAYPSFKLIRRGEIRQALIGEIKDANRLVDEAWKVYLKESRSGSEKVRWSKSVFYNKSAK